MVSISMTYSSAPGGGNRPALPHHDQWHVNGSQRNIKLVWSDSEKRYTHLYTIDLIPLEGGHAIYIDAGHFSSLITVCKGWNNSSKRQYKLSGAVNMKSTKMQEFRSAQEQSHTPHLPQDTKPKHRACQSLVVPTTTLTTTLEVSPFPNVPSAINLETSCSSPPLSWPRSTICPWCQQIPKFYDKSQIYAFAKERIESKERILKYANRFSKTKPNVETWWRSVKRISQVHHFACAKSDLP